MKKTQRHSISDSRLRSIIREILAEKMSLPFRTGDDFDAQENSAKESYEAAVAKLAAWDDNEAKKQALINKAKELGVTVDTAKKRLKGDPAYQFDVNLAAKKRKTLEDEVEKTKAAYAAYEPHPEYIANSTKNAGGKSTDNKELPPPGKKVYLSIDDVKPLTWYTWPKIVHQSGKSFGSSSTKTGDEVTGTGPGEEWLAYILGGQMQGAGVSFDIVTPDSRTWEVKAIYSPTEVIRPGTEGIRALDKSRKRIEKIMLQLKNFSIVSRRPGFFEKSDLSEVDQKIIAFVHTFIEDNFEMIVSKGEISRERFIALRGVLKAIGKFKLYHGQKPNDDAVKVDTYVSLNDKQIKVDKPTFIDVAKRVERSTGDKTIMSQFEKFDILLSTLKDVAFDNPTEFFNEWFNSIDVNNVFSQVNGLFVVNTEGFIMIPKGSLKKAFRFQLVSQGRPKFSFVLPWGPLLQQLNISS